MLLSITYSQNPRLSVLNWKNIYDEQYRQFPKLKSVKRVFNSKTARNAAPLKNSMNKCRASVSTDEILVIPICLSIMWSLTPFIIPIKDYNVKDENDEFYDNDEASESRKGAMLVIAFIPLFNFLTWTFAWLDTKRFRYLLFSIVYAAASMKILSSSSSLEENSWGMEIVVTILCVLHVILDDIALTSTPLFRNFDSILKSLNFFRVNSKYENNLKSPIDDSKVLEDMEMKIWDDKLEKKIKEKNKKDEESV